MDTKTLVVRIATTASLAIAVLFTVNCSLFSTSACSVKDRVETAIAKKRGGPKFHYVAVTATGDGGDADLITRQDVWGPFEFRALAGLYDAKRRDVGNGEFGMAILTLSGDSFQLACTRVGDSIRVTATKNPGTVELGTADFPGAVRLELSIAVDGAKATLSARRLITQPYTIVGEIASSTIGPFEPRLFVRDLKKKSVIGFDNSRILGRQRRPGTRTPAKQALDTIYEAGDLLTDAYYFADGEVDAASARAKTGAALTLLDAARIAIEALPASDDRSLCLSALAKGVASAQKVIGLVDNNSNSAKLYKPARSAVEQVLYASIALRRID